MTSGNLTWVENDGIQVGEWLVNACHEREGNLAVVNDDLEGNFVVHYRPEALGQVRIVVAEMKRR